MEQIIAGKITGFVSTLRENGFAVGVDEAGDTMRVAECLGVLAPQLLRDGWRGLLCARADEWHRFDDLFDSYWMPPNRQKMVETRTGGAGQLEQATGQKAAGGKAGPVLQTGTNDTGASGDDSTTKEGASGAQSLETADFSSLIQPEQTREIEAVIRRFARRLQRLKTRRAIADKAGRRLDLRRTMRRSVGAGGAPARLSYIAPRRVRPRLVLLLDVSRSMSLYSFFYLRVARALAAELSDIHVFLYHTHLTHVSDALSDPDPWRAQERLAILSAGWAGGTRIGDCIAAFNRQHAGRLVHGRTAVIIASDGYDTGTAGVLGRELAVLAQRAKRIVWLNPLKSQPGYSPTARGMAEALPYLGLFAAGHTLAALDDALSATLGVL
ncbi:MAG TPA: VWA domain-containing protein [Acidiphilium sp.]|nr:MAG: carbon monoxide dehydrogenase [Acidiphilium sp. 21-60-14]OYV89803.1 MAG: carbon monoxide dehydrogenase [Acidiphilium sp. 37-60-79]OZB39502.1 MAG: carbon monoxide dehydrogenase [Acidiphilium sp. 34-60-192]HQT88174.1 VWA domain-containing protein [Acidiphilium sp.]HQU24744.1 VWA domain-containing protein [Acidiphilium sp.]